MRYLFSDIVESEADLRETLGTPSMMAAGKQIDLIDVHARRYIERSPFALVATSNRDGRCDVSPRGDGPGFAKVLDDHTLLIPERPGNKRADTLTNVLDNPHVGIIFLIPTVEDTLRVNGTAVVIRDPDLMATMSVRGKNPQFAIAVEAEEVFFHCAKAFKRSGLWQPETWTDQSDLPTLGQILLDQVKPADTTIDDLEASIADSYATKLY